MRYHSHMRACRDQTPREHLESMRVQADATHWALICAHIVVRGHRLQSVTWLTTCILCKLRVCLAKLLAAEMFLRVLLAARPCCLAVLWRHLAGFSARWGAAKLRIELRSCARFLPNARLHLLLPIRRLPPPLFLLVPLRMIPFHSTQQPRGTRMSSKASVTTGDS